MFNWIARFLGQRAGKGAASADTPSGTEADQEAGYREALRLSPHNEGACIALCMLQVGQNRLQEALQVVEQGLQNIPDSMGLRLCQGNLLHALGCLAEAAAAYRAALAVDPQNAAALNNLGLVLLKQEDGPGAVELFARLHESDPGSSEVCHNLGVAHLIARQLPQAIGFLQRAVELAPANARAQGDLAHALLASGQLEPSASHFAAALALEPGLTALHRQFGVVLQKLGRNAAAAEQYQAALHAAAADASLHVDLGTALHALGRHEDALTCYRKALELDPARLVAQFNIGVSLRDLAENADAKHKQELMDQAAAAYRAALAIDDTHIESHNNLGTLLQERGEFEAAASCYHRILSIEPGNLSTHTNLGLLFESTARRVVGPEKIERMERAVFHYQAALEQDPGHIEAMIGIASIRGTQMRIEEALALYEQVLALDPGSAKARTNRGMVLLLQGELARGWPDYEYRHRYKLAPVLAKFTQPMWDGDAALEGKTIVLCADQGMGDTIQFLRYLDLVRERKPAAIYLEVQEPLQSLMQALPEVKLIDHQFGALPPSDFFCPIVSLPHAFRTTLETIPPVTPGMAASPERTAFWAGKLEKKDGLRVGLVWSGNPDFANDLSRSLPLQAILPLLEQPGIRFFSLQKQVRESDLALLERANNITHLGPQLHSFAETAAVMANLDLVISVDTAVAHLAGTLSVPVWIMLPFCNDFRWLTGRSDNPWYPTARLFRQPAMDDWDSVLAEVKVALRLEASKARPAPSAR